MNVEDIEKIKDTVKKTSSRGFGYFIKNVAMILLIMAGALAIAHPEILTDPVSYVKSVNPQSVWSLVFLFFIVTGVYQLGKSISDTDRNTNIDKKDELVREKHLEKVKYRLSIDSYISNVLKDILIDTGGSRVCVFEMHNGTNNLSGLPFLYADMTYEEVDADTDYVSDEFHDFNLTKYPFIMRHFEDGCWTGSANEVEEQDKKLAYRLKLTDSGFIATMVIHGNDMPMGFIVLAFKNSKEMNRDAVLMSLSTAAQKISNVLSK